MKYNVIKDYISKQARSKNLKRKREAQGALQVATQQAQTAEKFEDLIPVVSNFCNEIYENSIPRVQECTQEDRDEECTVRYRVYNYPTEDIKPVPGQVYRAKPSGPYARVLEWYGCNSEFINFIQTHFDAMCDQFQAIVPDRNYSLYIHQGDGCVELSISF